MPKQTTITLGSSIKEARKNKKLSQQKLADITGISKRHIAKIENEVSNPSFEIVAILAKELNISIDRILYGNNFSKDEIQIRELMIHLSKCKESQQKRVLNIFEVLVSEFTSVVEDD